MSSLTAFFLFDITLEGTSIYSPRTGFLTGHTLQTDFFFLRREDISQALPKKKKTSSPQVNLIIINKRNIIM